MADAASNDRGHGGRIAVTAQSIPALARHVKLRHDEMRQRWILLAPERLLTPSETAVAVLQLCDGARSVQDIARLLATEFDAPEDAILNDILPMLQDLADRHFLDPDPATPR
jgi:pyrroloquinoline quinone biosynthesis protein D